MVWENQKKTQFYKEQGFCSSIFFYTVRTVHFVWFFVDTNLSWICYFQKKTHQLWRNTTSSLQLLLACNALNITCPALIVCKFVLLEFKVFYTDFFSVEPTKWWRKILKYITVTILVAKCNCWESNFPLMNNFHIYICLVFKKHCSSAGHLPKECTNRCSHNCNPSISEQNKM